MKIVTYATHSEGMFDQLVDTGMVKVIGFGDKWKSFIGKGQKVLEYLESQPDDEIVVVVDGFDTKINMKKNFDNLEEDFKKLDCKVLYSLDSKTGLSDYIPKIIKDYFKSRVFGTCKDEQTANAGLYMGYVKYLKLVLKDVLEGDSSDDQRNLNKVCYKFPYLKVDVDNVIFQNCSHINEPFNAYFIGFPGSLTMNRFIRQIKEYTHYFIPEIIILLIILIFIYYK